jgi:hypothetical protein
MTVLIDCGRWQVLVCSVGTEPDDVATYDGLLCVYDAQADSALSGSLAHQAVYNTIPAGVFGGGLRAAAGLRPRGDFYKRYMEGYAQQMC